MLMICQPMLVTAAPISLDHITSVLQDDQDLAVKKLSVGERSILQATLALKAEQPDQAMRLLQVKANQSGDPLVDLLKAEAHRQQAIAAVREAGGSGKEVQLLASADLNRGLGEADARLHAFMDRLNPVDGEPLDILLAGPDVASVFMFDKARNRMFVYRQDADGKLRKITDEYVVTGSVKGDKKRRGDGRSPNGVYHFVKKLQGKELSSVYGPVAFPIDYPNALDQLHKKDGSGIWLHGYPTDVNRRPPQDTRGCFSLPNNRLLDIAKQVKLGKTWVIVGENLRFAQKQEKQQILASVQGAIERWRKDWASLNSEAYLSHYHPAFRSGKRDLSAWKQYKQRINGRKTFIHVKFGDLTLIHDPNNWQEGEVVVAEFNQHYQSDNFSDSGRKRLYLARSSADSAWKILLEESL
ncbi:MAG: L,D-transpeptidase family protein [Mariprofundus sp.]